MCESGGIIAIIAIDFVSSLLGLRQFHFDATCFRQLKISNSSLGRSLADSLSSFIEVIENVRRSLTLGSSVCIVQLWHVMAMEKEYME